MTGAFWYESILHQTVQKVKVMGGTTLIGMSDQTYQPSLSQLRAFVSVAEYRHFGTAAARSGVSQPTLSQALAALEAGLGVRLIERSTRRVLVTADGQRLLGQAKQILEAADGFVASAAGSGDSLTGPLRIGLIPTVALHSSGVVAGAAREVAVVGAANSRGSNGAPTRCTAIGSARRRGVGASCRNTWPGGSSCVRRGFCDGRAERSFLGRTCRSHGGRARRAAVALARRRPLPA